MSQPAQLPSRLLRNPGVLSSRYMPPKPLHRDRQISELLQSLEQCKLGQPRNTLMIGPPGTGKTLIAKCTIQSTGPLTPNFRIIYINCQRTQTGYRICHQLIKELDRWIPIKGFSGDQAYAILLRILDEQRSNLAICLDELDRLASRNPGMLSRICEIDEHLEHSNLELIGISNQLEFTKKLTQAVKSRLVQHQILFPPYTKSQLVDILHQRAELALAPGCFEFEAIQCCAELAARDGGDAREAIQLLRRSVELAQSLGATKLTKEHVERTREDLVLEEWMLIVDSLDSTRKSVLRAVLDLGESNLGECYSKYRKLDPVPVSFLRFRKLILDLEKLELIQYQPRSKLVSLAIPAQILRKLMLKESS